MVYDHWAIGSGEEYSDLEYQDQVEGRALDELLEKESVTLFYQRGSDGLPREWIQRMKRSMQTCIPVFSTTRMVRDYAERFYLPSGARFHSLQKENHRAARELWDWKMGLYQRWAQIRIEEATAVQAEALPVGGALEVSVRVHLGPINHESVEVQVYNGSLDEQGQVLSGAAVALRRDAKWKGEPGFHLFRGQVPCTASGRFGYAVRVLPHHPNLPSPFVPGLITWG